ncbi:Rieske 2Fe-2S domain-containing protein [Nitrogeniibacter mangrovi]|uniref:Rieske 2Fe-2S domain-containing protein n=1 Tax=Nitrogeniibacter mangrovi TaxID=2016596 RepID=A0A6C1B2Z3_9RHOO|nr:Rieske 2Fe-2S domain-containing protein [Nitrogeniibacter mangrovi]QID17753.1 Rieske 2Fe-2S domain-containing protein [Nitrogeniibacter mangrovi]
MARTERLICASEALTDGDAGVRFQLERHGQTVPAFAVRFDGRAYAYVNACAHVPVELDWMEGDFFDSDRRYLICATHGARYEPETGYCVMGPCRGARLQPLTIVERDGQVWLVEES